jgi:hypothetical protein
MTDAEPSPRQRHQYTYQRRVRHSYWACSYYNNLCIRRLRILDRPAVIPTRSDISSVAYFLWIVTHSEASISTVSFGLVAAVLIVIGIPASFYWVDRREHPPISIAYVVPAFWQASPSAKWFMMIQHCGPEPVYNVDTIFIDEDRAKQISTHTTVTPAEINAEQVTLHYDEIDPAQGGSAKLFPWTPLNADEEHYSARIVSRYATFDETLQIVRVSQKWRYKMKVSDVTRSRPIIDCQDAGFPEPPVNPRPVSRDM